MARVFAVAAVVLCLVSAPARGQEAKIDVKTASGVRPDDVDALGKRLEALDALCKKNALSMLDYSALKEGLVDAARATVLVTLQVEHAPLSDVLMAIVRATVDAGRGVGLVIGEEDLELLSTVRITASFARTPAADAVRALLRSQDASDRLTVDVSEEGAVFVVTVHEAAEAEEEAPATPTPPAPPARPTRPAPAPQVEEEEPAGPRGFLGVSSDGVMVPDQGVRITEVQPGSPAQQAGLQAGDLVRAVDGAELESFDQLRAAVQAKKVGDRVVLDLTRAGQHIRAVVVLGEAPR
jgi:hypothetical protein